MILSRNLMSHDKDEKVVISQTDRIKGEQVFEFGVNITRREAGLDVIQHLLAPMSLLQNVKIHIASACKKFNTVSGGYSSTTAAWKMKCMRKANLVLLRQCCKSMRAIGLDFDAP